ncbi:breast cancer anti-estrogen resistance protein 1-like [Frieseomelitta varia]|uniref:breast cancer anti-estrogen resistance protein 1-like n=1 Tax=Frieseomelitta varia TaxID=561572 RepID=UPI001CB6A912|nr:breast cancer anti-estrogen resistance protein 1-like [Frieseomelitta varia]
MLPQTPDIIPTTLNQQKCVKARALYDNIAEAPDELAFRKGDVLTVLEQNTAGLEGWWLCALRGRQVITSF